MKKLISTGLVVLFMTLAAHSQTLPPKTDSLQPPKLSLTLDANQWNQLFQIIRQNPKMTGAECENTIEFITKQLVAIKQDSVKKK